MPEKKQYIIDWVYADNYQMFTSNAALTEDEENKLWKHLMRLERDGLIIGPQIYERPAFIPQTYEEVLGEINNALNVEDDNADAATS